MTLIEIERAVRKLLPGAYTDTDNNGQLIIYTNLMMLDENDPQTEMIEYVEPVEVVND